MNGEVGRPKTPFQASSPRRAGQAYERDTLAATQATIKNDDPIVRPPALEKAVLYARSRYANLWHRTGTRKSTVTGVRHLTEFRMI